MHRRLPLPRALLVMLTWMASAVVPASARAQPLFDHGQDALEDQYLDGEFDEEDLAAMRLGAHTTSSDLQGGTWISLVGFTKQLMSGRDDVGGMVIVGIALDRIAAGPKHHALDAQRGPPPAPAPAPPPAPAPSPSPSPSPAPAPAPVVVKVPAPLPPPFARACVAAALRTSGLGVDDSALDDLVARARTSALLPETRLRGMRLWSDADHTTTVASTDTASFYDAVGANLVLELRLTWRFDRLLYAGDEASIERVRLERQDARTRVATRVLDVLFNWQRARVSLEAAAAGSAERVEAQLRVDEAEATLDVLTGGWFSQRRLDQEGSGR